MKKNDTFQKDGKEVKRQPVTTRTRVMGYLSPTIRYNIGKKTEFYSRKYFKTDNSIYTNKQFIDRYTAPLINNILTIN